MVKKIICLKTAQMTYGEDLKGFCYDNFNPWTTYACQPFNSIEEAERALRKIHVGDEAFTYDVMFFEVCSNGDCSYLGKRSYQSLTYDQWKKEYLDASMWDY